MSWIPGCCKSSWVLDPLYFEKSYIALHYLRLQRPRDTDIKTRGYWLATIIRGQKQKDQVRDQVGVRIKSF